MSGQRELVDALVKEVLDFVENPELARIRPSNSDSQFYLSWITTEPTIPCLATVAGVDHEVIAAAVSKLEARKLMVRNYHTSFSVVLRGKKHADLPKLSVLQNAASWIDQARQEADPREARRNLHTAFEELVTYKRVYDGSPEDPRYVELKAQHDALYAQLAPRRHA